MSTPSDVPVTTPPAVTLATVLEALQVAVPTAVGLVNVTGIPRVIIVLPDMVPAPGFGLTVTVWVATAVPQPLVTV